LLQKKLEYKFSIIIPCRNEEDYIEKCIQSLLKQKEMNFSFEILIVDGMSDDNTRLLVSEIVKNNKNVKLLDNQNNTTPYALNIGIDNSNGEFICILGAHSEHDEYYLKNSFDLISEHPEVDCFGGPIISVGFSDFGKATAIAMASPIGIGNAKHRFPNYEGYAEMACYPIFRREVFSKIGKYDESLTRNQDDEFCFRLTQTGGKVFISPKVKSTYFVRNSINELFSQYYQYGYWKVIVLWKHKVPISYRQFVPLFFYVLIVLLVIISILLKTAFIGFVLPITYLIIITYYSLVYLKKNRFKIVLLIIISIITLHLSYACGFIAGLFKSTFGRN